jgi:tetratricopeptide (TPR) repeat protein
MTKKENPVPAKFIGVMVSSTFDDLKEHRTVLEEALKKERLFPIGMEWYVLAHEHDLIASSLEMVRDASAYIGLISRRYGLIEECPVRNSECYSLSRLEFEEAQRLGLPTLIFTMRADHELTEAGVELDSEKRKKLEEYRVRAKEGRIYEEFSSLKEFTKKAIHAIARLKRDLEKQGTENQSPDNPTISSSATPEPQTRSIPAPPAFYAEPRYKGSHTFVGRTAELERLSDWAAASDPHPVLLFEAIGGSGKSMLTWEWTTNYSTTVRNDWAGRFWYSFYEKGAIMADFCRYALSYMTGRPVEELLKKKTSDLAEQLLFHLQDRPWLLILDGLERVLVAYHRFDAAQIADEQADTVEDQIAKRDPYGTIRPEDDELLRSLANASPSKILITTRLTPSILMNQSRQSVPGVLRMFLAGLRPPDAEKLLLSCGIRGNSEKIRDYLKLHCDCHPLVTGVLAGLINEYLPDRGNFDKWASDPMGGGALDLGDLDIIQKRNHILLAAMAALPEKSQQLLSMLAILPESIDFATLGELNPHLPLLLEKVEKPENPEDEISTKFLSLREFRVKSYQDRLERWEEYEANLALRQKERPAALKKLTADVIDLERRGLLQYDSESKRYDLHPVVRSVAVGKLADEEKIRYGQPAVDHFSRLAHIPYEEADSIDDVKDGLRVIRILLQMGKYQQAANTFLEISIALLRNLEEYTETLSLIHHFFPGGWSTLPESVSTASAMRLKDSAGFALTEIGEPEEALDCYNSIMAYDLKEKNWIGIATSLTNISRINSDLKRYAKVERFVEHSLEIGSLADNRVRIFQAWLFKFALFFRLGRFGEADSAWQAMDSMGSDWPRSGYIPGAAEYQYAIFQYYKGTLEEKFLTKSEQVARAGKSRVIIRDVHRLRGEWNLEQGRWASAAESLHEAARMAREVGYPDLSAETMFYVAKFHLGELAAPEEIAERLARGKKPNHRWLAELWLAMGNRRQAEKHAVIAYKETWADGEPYVDRCRLNKARALLKQLSVEIADPPPYDPTKDEKLPWEDDLAAAIEELREEKKAREGS